MTPRGSTMAKACSRRPEDVWIGEVFLTAVAALVAFVIWGWALVFVVTAFITSISEGPVSAVTVWLAATMGFPGAAGWSWRLVRHGAHRPVAKRLYVLAISGGLVAWAGMVVTLLFVGLVVAGFLGQPVML